jgi:hypothetical protein
LHFAKITFKNSKSEISNFKKLRTNEIQIFKLKKKGKHFFLLFAYFIFALIYKNQNEKWEERLNSEKEEK